MKRWVLALFIVLTLQDSLANLYTDPLLNYLYNQPAMSTDATSSYYDDSEIDYTESSDYGELIVIDVHYLCKWCGIEVITDPYGVTPVDQDEELEEE